MLEVELTGQHGRIRLPEVAETAKEMSPKLSQEPGIPAPSICHVQLPSPGAYIFRCAIPCLIKLAFYDADTDRNTDTDTGTRTPTRPKRLYTLTSDTRDFLARILARKSTLVSVVCVRVGAVECQLYCVVSFPFRPHCTEYNRLMLRAINAFAVRHALHFRRPLIKADITQTARTCVHIHVRRRTAGLARNDTATIVCTWLAIPAATAWACTDGHTDTTILTNDNAL